MNSVLERYATQKLTVQAGIRELVKGHDKPLTERVTPLVRTGDVILDCAGIERIDAAGIATLICLYGTAHEAGNSFYVSNITAHVKEILELVGLDRILVVQDAASAYFVRPAA
jgi:anti-anti-sigma factor